MNTCSKKLNTLLDPGTGKKVLANAQAAITMHLVSLGSARHAGPAIDSLHIPISLYITYL